MGNPLKILVQCYIRYFDGFFKKIHMETQYNEHIKN